MRCYDCQYYGQTATCNRCSLTESECFHTDDNCTLVNEDGSINYEDEYFKNTCAEVI